MEDVRGEEGRRRRLSHWEPPHPGMHAHSPVEGDTTPFKLQGGGDPETREANRKMEGTRIIWVR